MSDNMEQNAGETRESVDEKIKMILQGLSSLDHAPQRVLDALKKMSDDPDVAKLLQKREETESRKEEQAQHYAEQIHSFFESKGWHYTSMDPGGKIMLLGFRMRNSTVRLEVIVESKAECIRFNISLLTCQEEYRLAMCKYLAELNLPLRYGAFHMDMEDGTVTYRYSTSYRGLPFCAETFDGYVEACVYTADSNYKKLGKIANGNFDGAEKKEWFQKIKAFAIALSE